MTTRERLTIAAVVSAGLHALFISGAWLRAPVPPVEYPPLEARLAPAPPPEPVARVSPPPEAPPPPLRPRKSVPPPAAPAAIAQAASAPAMQPAPEVSAEPLEAASLPGEPSGSQQAAPAESVAALPAEPPPPATAGAESAPPRRLPRKGTITYALTGEGFNVGRAIQSWEVGAGSYKLVSDAETTGIVDVFRPQRLRWLSKGAVTQHGLRPETFLVSRTRRGQTEASEALFDWKTGSLTYGPARERATAALPGDTQDIMSFIYQLSLAPPAPGRYRLPITTGSKFETYEIEVRTEEAIETPLGTLRTLPVRQQRRPGAESIEIWLAAQYRYLPVKIRYFNREGNPVGEQVASESRRGLAA